MYDTLTARYPLACQGMVLEQDACKAGRVTLFPSKGGHLPFFYSVLCQYITRRGTPLHSSAIPDPRYAFIFGWGEVRADCLKHAYRRLNCKPMACLDGAAESRDQRVVGRSTSFFWQ